MLITGNEFYLFSRSNVYFYNFLSPMPLLLSSISLLFGSICEFGRSLMGLTVGHFSILLLPTFAQAILYPYDTPSRETKSLDGFWTFKPDPSGAGFEESWFLHPLSGDDLMQMPVPSSYNDISTSSTLRDRYSFKANKASATSCFFSFLAVTISDYYVSRLRIEVIAF